MIIKIMAILADTMGATTRVFARLEESKDLPLISYMQG
jgi:hypothetical protein